MMPAASFAPAPSPARLVEAARSYLGIVEGSVAAHDRLSIATPDRAWCAAFATWCERLAGLPYPRDIGATWRAEEHVAWHARNGRDLGRACLLYQPGDLILTERHNADGHVIGHHVAIVVSDAGGPTVHVIAGNHKNAVGEYEQERGRIVEAARISQTA